MITGSMLVMFIVGFIIFVLYIIGLLTMITKAHKQQREDLLNDPELRDYYNRHNNYSGDYDWNKNNPHVKNDSYVNKIFKNRNKTKGKKNVGKATYWD